MSLQLFGSWGLLQQVIIVLPCIACAFPWNSSRCHILLLVLLKHLVIVMQLMKTLSWFGALSFLCHCTLSAWKEEPVNNQSKVQEGGAFHLRH